MESRESQANGTWTDVLVRAPNHLGDACMALPALWRLTDAGLALTITGRPWVAELFAGCGWQFLALPRPPAARVRALRGWAGRRGLLLTNSFSTALEFRLGGLLAAGYATDGRSWLLRPAIPVPPAWRQDMHTVAYYDALAVAALARWQGPGRMGSARKGPSAELGLPVPAAAQVEARRRLWEAGVPTDYCALCPLAVGLHHGQAKAWNGFNELCRRLIDRGTAVVCCPGPGEQEAARAALPGATVLEPATLDVFAAILASSRVVVANDSGPGHLAAAVGAPLVSVFGVTEPQKTQPWGSRVHRVGDYGAWPQVDQVLAAVTKYLAIPGVRPANETAGR